MLLSPWLKTPNKSVTWPKVCTLSLNCGFSDRGLDLSCMSRLILTQTIKESSLITEGEGALVQIKNISANVYLCHSIENIHKNACKIMKFIYLSVFSYVCLEKTGHDII